VNKFFKTEVTEVRIDKIIIVIVVIVVVVDVEGKFIKL
jgi:hypothetical protein